MLPLTADYTLPVVVNGTNFGTQTTAWAYPAGGPPAEVPVELVSSQQLVVRINLGYSASPVEWVVEVENPQPGGGRSESTKFTVTPANFVQNPFLISLLPETVAAGGPAFTLTVNGNNFVTGSQIVFYSTFLSTTVISDKQVRAVVPAALIQLGGRYPVSVVNPDNGGSSNRLYVDVR